MLTLGLLWRLTSRTLILLYGPFTLPAQCLCRYLVLEIVLDCVVYLCHPFTAPWRCSVNLACALNSAQIRCLFVTEIYFGPPCCQRVLIVHCSVIRDQWLWVILNLSFVKEQAWVVKVWNISTRPLEVSSSGCALPVHFFLNNIKDLIGVGENEFKHNTNV
jgi:hypothetical protein